ncbi:Ldh family oxidoreductase [Aeromicrobium choanae]|uniref:Malate/lactate/ureidoglycolate dehydrogenase, LDH2 family n=1 Tax=Aeromicrobium choanae TaxID=1736691 RepID=A0A1T4Z5Y6_9ACTN|nr:Ldh family oxidoreductase [Aeromicrobium choanae]SKB09424.1 Malate/lactate/ureidoglycolate dehydrogenase, LDH2 family [Aeromicrobium choanae]
MKIDIKDAHELVRQAMSRFGYDDEQQTIIADHLIDCTVRGFDVGGLPRAATLVERLRRSEPFGPIVVEQETASSIALDGGDQLGYIVAKQLTETLIEKARHVPVVAGTARRTWCTGMFTYYLEMVTAAGLVGFVASSGGPTVAPHGGAEGRFGTNPVAWGFPTPGQPIIWDIGTSAAMLADLSFAIKTGQELEPGLAFGPDGAPTTDPAAALDGGAIAPWGGHKGSGLAISAQLLGMMSGAEADPPWLTDMGFFMVVMDPNAFSADFSQRAGDYGDWVRATKPVDPQSPVRMPFDRSVVARDATLAAGEIEVADEIVDLLRDFVGSPA